MAMTPIAAGTWESAAEIDELLRRHGIETVAVGSLGATVNVAQHQADVARALLHGAGRGANVIEDRDLLPATNVPARNVDRNP